MISPCHHTTSVKNLIAKHCFPIIKMDAVGALRTAPHRISLAKWQVASGEANVVKWKWSEPNKTWMGADV